MTIVFDKLHRVDRDLRNVYPAGVWNNVVECGRVQMFAASD